MKKFNTRGVAAVAIIAALGMSAPAIASADTTTTIAPAASITTTVHVTHAQWKAWQKLEDAYLDQLKVINRNFRASIIVARAEYKAAIRAAKGSLNHQAARVAARAALTLSIANAMQARATALTSLSAPPAPPAGAPRSAYIINLQAINQTFRNSVAAADAAFAAAFPGATTAPERAVVRATLELAIANAAVLRAGAFVLLGPPPASPDLTPPTTTTTVPVTTTTA